MDVLHGIGVGIASVMPLDAGGGGIVPRGTRVEVFQQIFWIFLVLGTLVGVVVVSYMLYTAYRYRAGGDEEYAADRPRLGELPRGGGGGRKLFLSFAISAVIVISLIAGTYGSLRYVDSQGPAASGDSLTVHVEGFRFGWAFVYPDGRTTSTLRVPEDRPVELVVTSRDVFHTFGIPGLRVKADAIPGQTTDTWFEAEQPGSYTARCYELCGVGHSHMTAEVIVMEPEEFEDWYNATGNASA